MAASGQFEDVIAKMPVLMQRLQASPALSRDNLREVRECGLYVFYENGAPIYVGRSNRLKERILEHGRRSTWHNSATFAFLLAEEEARKQGIDIASLTRTQQQNDPAFGPLYSQAKERVSKMAVRVVYVEDPIEQTVFEVYAALTLGTRYNDFDNH